MIFDAFDCDETECEFYGFSMLVYFSTGDLNFENIKSLLIKIHIILVIQFGAIASVVVLLVAALNTLKAKDSEDFQKLEEFPSYNDVTMI